MSIRVLLCDAVGTLIYPKPSASVAYHQLGQRFGSTLSVEEIEQRFRTAFGREDARDRTDSSGSPHGLGRMPTDEQRERARWRSIVAEVFRELPDTECKLFETLWSHFADRRHWALFDDVAELWSTMADGDLTVGIASNFDARLPRICSELPPLDQCRHVFWSAQVGYAKPSPEFFAQVQQQLAVNPQQILLVGDNPVNDFQGALAAGWHAVLLDRNGKSGEPTAISSLDQLPNYLK